ncbi:AAA family ATPase [Candidatus Frankia alpina]|uniref:AAA family ATPase n=1 Tax=Candidatus Frankia alpina TaxID=2699483 RepID=UPI0013D61077|nr:AAA family ATPase [Candidatus Frankia alpina]
MRIRSFGLERYGAFEGRGIAFGAGLTMVVGDNETGKSTTLAGLSDLLWGFRPGHQDHTFAVGTLSLTARVELPDGQEVDLRRRRTGLSTSPDGHPFTPLWGQGGREHWRRAFGLSREELKDGGFAVFRGTGDLAELVFAARSGRAVRELLSTLEEEKEKLYKPHRGNRSVRVRAALLEFDRVRAAAESSMTRAGAVRDAQDEQARHQRSADIAAARLSSAAERYALADQRRRALPGVHALIGLRAEHARLRVTGLVLPAEQLDAFDTARHELDAAAGDAERLETDLAAKARDRAALHIDDALLTDGAAISRLERLIEARAGDATTAAEHDREAEDRADEATRLLHGLVRPGGLVGPDGQRPTEELLAALHIPVNVAADLDTLGARLDALSAEVGRADEAARVALARERAAVSTAAPRDPRLIVLLRGVVTTIRAEGSASQQLRASVDTAATALGDRHDALHRAGAREVDAAPPAGPSRDAVRLACQRLAESDHAWVRSEKEVADAGSAVDQARQQLARTVVGQRLPDPEMLAQVRAERDDLWARLVEAAASGLTPTRAEELLPCLATTVRRADEIADDLIGHASTAAKQAQKQRVLTDATDRQRAAAVARPAALDAKEQAQRDWDAFWNDLGLTPPEVDQADDVRRALDDAQQAQTTLLAAERRITALTGQADAQRATLAEALTQLGQPNPGADLDTALAAAEQILTDDDAAREERASAALHARHTADARQAHADRAADLHTAQQQWTTQLQTAGLPSAMTPAGWAAWHTALTQAQAAQHTTTRARTHAADAQARIDTFAGEVAALATRHSDDGHSDDGHDDPPPAAVLDRLAERLRAARAARAAAKVMDRTITELTDQLAAAHARRTDTAEHLNRLRDEAELPPDHPLTAVLERSRAVQTTRAEQTATETMICTAAPDHDLETLVKDLADRDDADLDRELTDAHEERDACSTAQDEAFRALGASTERLRLLRGARSVADQHAQAQEHLALVAEGAERYLIATIQHHLLREQLEAYERRHASPLLGDAGRILERLTGGYCVALRAVDRGDQRFLRVVRADEQEREPGELSEGTADQVYLALRLAAIDQLQRDPRRPRRRVPPRRPRRRADGLRRPPGHHRPARPGGTRPELADHRVHPSSPPH